MNKNELPIALDKLTEIANSMTSKQRQILIIEMMEVLLIKKNISPEHINELAKSVKEEII